MPTISELGKRAKLKYPGAYDDLNDADLGRLVQKKFPGAYDDFTDEPEAKSLGKFITEKVPESAKATAGMIGSAIAHPIETVKAIGRAGAGAVEKLIPGEQPQEASFDALMDFYVQRYGSLEAAKETAYNDPVGFLMDASTVLAGAGAGVRLGAKAGTIATAGRGLVPSGQVASAAAGKLGAAAQALDPIQIATKAIGKGARKAVEGRRIAPFEGKADRPVIEAGKRLEVDLPASAKTTSRAVPVIEAVEGKGFFGGKIAAKVDAANARLNAIADDLVSKTGASSDIVDAGKAISQGMDAYHDAWIASKNALYDEATKLMGESDKIASAARANLVYGDAVEIAGLPGVVVTPVQTRAFLEEIIRAKRGAQAVTPFVEDVAFWESQLKRMDDAPLSVKAWRNGIKELNQKAKYGTDPIVTGNKAAIQRLVATMADDLDDTLSATRPDIAEALQAANAVYKDGIKRLNSSLGKKIGAAVDQPDRIIPKLMEASTSSEDIRRIFEVMPEEGINAVRAATLESLFSKARGPAGNFKPAGLESQLKRIGDPKLETLFTPEQIGTLQDIADISRGLGKVERVLSGSQTAYLARIGAGVAGLFTNWIAAFQIIVGDALLSKFITSPTGQKLLTEGIQFTGGVGASIEKIAPEIAIGGRGAFQAERVREEAKPRERTGMPDGKGVWAEALRRKSREAQIGP